MQARRPMLPACAVIALALLGTAAGAAGAPRTCRDALLATPTRQYSCDAAYAYTETGPPYFQGTAPLAIEFDEASPPDPAVFVMRSLVNGTEVYCACDSQGTTAKPRFLSSMSFTCQGIVDIIRGDVSGRNGDRIRNWRIDEIKPQTQGGSELNIGGCVRTR